jgi:hypothetical protein
VDDFGQEEVDEVADGNVIAEEEEVYFAQVDSEDRVAYAAPEGTTPGIAAVAGDVATDRQEGVDSNATGETNAVIEQSRKFNEAAATMKNQAEVDEASTENLTKLPVAKESELGDSVDVPDGRSAAIRQMIKEKTKAAEKQKSATKFNDLTQDMTEKWIRKAKHEGYRETYNSCGLNFFPILRHTVFDGYWK